MKNTSERLILTNGDPPDDATVEKMDSGIFMVKGPEFHEKFMANYAMPRRIEMAMMVLASQIQRHGLDKEYTALAKSSWDMADALILTERSSLDERMSEYWDYYLASNKQTDEVIKALIDAHQDYSL